MHNHTYEEVARRKGNRVRYQCSCRKIGPWVQVLVPEKAPQGEPRELLDQLSVQVLRARAKSLGLRGYSKMRHGELVDLIASSSRA